MKTRFVLFALIAVIFSAFMAACPSPTNSGTEQENEYDQYGFDKNGVHQNGTIYDNQGYKKNGYNAAGWNREHKNEITNTDYDSEGYKENGFNEAGWNRTGTNINGTQYDNDGYNVNGYDANGNQKPGNESEYDADGYHKTTGYNVNGWHKDGGDLNQNGTYFHSTTHLTRDGEQYYNGVDYQGNKEQGQGIEPVGNITGLPNFSAANAVSANDSNGLATIIAGDTSSERKGVSHQISG
jgi:hypothetical protein